MNGLGRKVVGTIQGQHAVRCQALTDVEKHGIESARSDRIEPLADLSSTRNLLHTQQGVDVIVALGLLQGALVVQK